VVHGPLHYKILLGQPWVYAMAVVVSTYFRTITFPHKGGITIIEQTSFFASNSQVMGSIPFFNGPSLSLQSIGVGLFKYPSLMGTFTLLPPSGTSEVVRVETCYMLSSTSSNLKRIINNNEDESIFEVMSLSPIELA